MNGNGVAAKRMKNRVLGHDFRLRVGPSLRGMGFQGRYGHWVRSVAGITQVVELQHSVYGGRVTVNLGLDLDILKPMLRWMDRPALGPHAHDCTRWVRIGLTMPEATDVWWPFSAEDAEGRKDVADLLGSSIFSF